MGIQGLLGALKPYTARGNVRDYAGAAVAVDASSWLHKSVYSIADHYVEQCLEGGSSNNGNSPPDAQCVRVASNYVVERCRELLTGAGVARIYLVLDGRRCPLKAATNRERDARRAEHLRQARRYRQQNRRDLMFEKYKACIKVTDALAVAVARTVEQAFRGDGGADGAAAAAAPVQIVWSPHEADSQLVQLVLEGRAHAVITEDSDVLVYQAAVQRAFPVLYKLDRRTGDCDCASMAWLLDPDYDNTVPKSSTNSNNNNNISANANDGAAAADKNSNNNSSNNAEQSQLQGIFDIFAARQRRRPGWGARLFVQACVLAGCDYAPRQLPGVGLVTAFKHVRTAGLAGSPAALHKVFHQILLGGGGGLLPPKVRRSVPDLNAFEELLAQSEAVFYYHPVVNVGTGRVVHLTDLPRSSADGGGDCGNIGGGEDNPPRSRHTAGPSLERFANTEFLGQLVANPHCGISSDVIPRQVLQQQQQQSNFFCKRGETKKSDHHHRQQQQQQASAFVQQALQQQQQQRNSSHASSITSPSTATSRQKTVPRPMENPYKQAQQKQQQQQHSRKPFQPHKANVGDADAAAAAASARLLGNPYKKLTPAQAYAKRHADARGMERVRRIVTAQLPATARSHEKKQKRQQQQQAEAVSKNSQPSKSSLQQYRHSDEHNDNDVRFVKRRFPKDGSRATLPTPKKVVVVSKKRPRYDVCDDDNNNQQRRSTSTNPESEEEEEDHHDEAADWTRPWPAQRDASGEARADSTSREPDQYQHYRTDEFRTRRRRHAEEHHGDRAEVNQLPADQSALERELSDSDRRRASPKRKRTSPLEKSTRPQRPVLSFSLGGGPGERDSSNSNEPRERGIAKSDDDSESEGDEEESPMDDESEVCLSPAKKPTTLSFDYEQEAGATSPNNQCLASEDMFDPRRFMDSTSPPPSSYRGDEAEEEEEEEEGTTSAYFQQKPNATIHEHLLSRRVTIDADRAAKASESQVRRFAFYDQASPELRQHEEEVVDLCNDEEKEEDLDHTIAFAQPAPVQNLLQKAPKFNASIGPAKTLRSRYNDSSSAAQQPPKKKKSILKQFLERNRKRSGQPSANSNNNNNNNNRPLLSFKIGSGKRWKNAGPRQSSLLSHFAARAPRLAEEEDL